MNVTEPPTEDGNAAGFGLTTAILRSPVAADGASVDVLPLPNDARVRLVVVKACVNCQLDFTLTNTAVLGSALLAAVDVVRNRYPILSRVGEPPSLRRALNIAEHNLYVCRRRASISGTQGYV